MRQSNRSLWQPATPGLTDNQQNVTVFLTLNEGVLTKRKDLLPQVFWVRCTISNLRIALDLRVKHLGLINITVSSLSAAGGGLYEPLSAHISINCSQSASDHTHCHTCVGCWMQNNSRYPKKHLRSTSGTTLGTSK